MFVCSRAGLAASALDTPTGSMMFSRRSKEAGGSPSDKAVVDGDTTLHCAKAPREKAKKARRPVRSPTLLLRAMAAAVFGGVGVGVGVGFGGVMSVVLSWWRCVRDGGCSRVH